MMEKKVVQITSGKGPLECAWSVSKVYDILKDESLKKGLQLELISKEKHQSGLEYSHLIFSLQGMEVNRFLDQWLGTIQVIAQSPFRKNHRRKNWFIAIFEIHENEAIDLDLNEIKFESFRSSGPGGQHVNKVSTGIRAIHLSSGLTAKTVESRSQSMNKKLAVDKIKLQLHKINATRQAEVEQLQWKLQSTIQRGQPKRIIYEKDFIN